MTSHLGFWEGITDTMRARGQFRLILQPAVAIILGLRLGIADAKAGEEPFVLRLVMAKGRAALLKAAFKKVLVPFTVAIVLDGILQYIELGYVRPLAALIVGAMLIWLPFAVSRAFTNRIYRRTHHLHIPHEGAA